MTSVKKGVVHTVTLEEMDGTLALTSARISDLEYQMQKVWKALADDYGKENAEWIEIERRIEDLEIGMRNMGDKGTDEARWWREAYAEVKAEVATLMLKLHELRKDRCGDTLLIAQLNERLSQVEQAIIVAGVMDNKRLCAIEAKLEIGE